ncbi:MAG: hypothetical protein N3D82_02735 [Ignisphaera sp.]|nr:hypothetical protein [Ignisphaera sp.]MCX8167935.1 hypothetical protein [Ignisphaera sp.]MDW8086250.1 hypothetical protein [Ignisphaera sp.]
MIYTVSSRDFEALSEILKVICRETLYFCYRVVDVVEPILSLAWAETLQSTPVECIMDSSCAAKVIDMFGMVVRIALTGEYVYTIDVEKLKSVFKSLEKVASFLQPSPRYSGL